MVQQLLDAEPAPIAPPPGAATKAAVAVAPITQFSAADTATLLWALAKLQLQLPSSLERRFWPAVLRHVSSGAVIAQLTPRDTALLAWSLLQLQAPMPAGWFQGWLDAQAAAIPGKVAVTSHALFDFMHPLIP